MENLVTLGFLILLQLVLGFDNLLYISLESQRAPADKQAYVRRMGIGIAIALRIILLFVVLQVIERVKVTFLSFDNRFLVAEFNFHSVIVLLGGAFIMYTAVKEIWHMISYEEVHGHEAAAPKSVGKVLFWIILMNLIFSFDSILSAIALTDVFWVMATAIVICGILMILLADKVSVFLQKNRMYEVLGLFILFIVGIMLLSEGGHLAHMKLFGSEIHAMSKGTFYFVITVLVLTDIVQTRYQRKLVRKKEAAAAHKEGAHA